jgi:hypothetical protein
MGWKKLPYWLKGGLIGMFFIIIIFIIGELSGYILYNKWVIIPILNLFFVPSVIILFQPLYDTNSGLVMGASILLISLILYFIIGAIVGFIINKLKRK